MRSAFEAAESALGGVDRIFYAAGAMADVGLDEFSIEKDREIVETTFLGAIAWLDLAAARFQEKKGGQIVGISSVAGERGRKPYPAYGAAKAGVTTFLESLRNRLSQPRRVGRHGEAWVRPDRHAAEREEGLLGHHARSGAPSSSSRAPTRGGSPSTCPSAGDSSRS